MLGCGGRGRAVPGRTRRRDLVPGRGRADGGPDGRFAGRDVRAHDRQGRRAGLPFGATHCRFTLRKEGRQILERAFSIQDDGAVARADNFDVRWRADGVQVVVSGSEQGDRVYILGFDGSVGESEVARRPTFRRTGRTSSRSTGWASRTGPSARRTAASPCARRGGRSSSTRFPSRTTAPWRARTTSPCAGARTACRSSSPGASRGIGSTSWDLTEAQRKAKWPAGRRFAGRGVRAHDRQGGRAGLALRRDALPLHPAQGGAADPRARVFHPGRRRRGARGQLRRVLARGRRVGRRLRERAGGSGLRPGI